MHFKRGVSAGLLATALALLGVSSVEATQWPIPVASYRKFGPDLRSDGAWWCGYQQNGSYGASFFGHTMSYVNFGGQCNAQWGQPAGKLWSRAQAFQGTVVVAQSAWTPNAANAWSVQATVPRVASATKYRHLSEWYGPNGSGFWAYYQDRS